MLAAAGVTVVAYAQVNFNQLPAATLPLTGNEIMPGNQGATTVRYTTLNIEAYIATTLHGATNAWTNTNTFSTDTSPQIIVSAPTLAENSEFTAVAGQAATLSVMGNGNTVGNALILQQSGTSTGRVKNVAGPLLLGAGTQDAISIATTGAVTVNAPTAGNAVSITGFAGTNAAETITGGNASGATGLSLAGTFAGAGQTNFMQVADTGNTNGVNFKMIGNGGTTPSKTIHVTSGFFQVANDAYSANILSMDDSGNTTLGGNLQTNLGGSTIKGALTVSAPAAGNAVNVTGFAGTGSGISITGGNNASAQGLSVTGTFAGAGPTNLVQFNDTGNSNGVNFKMVGNGGTTPSKTVRVLNGIWQLINDGYSNTLVSFDDSGNMTLAGGGVWGAATGGNQGAGTLNAVQLYVNATPLYQTGTFNGTFTDGTNNIGGTVIYQILGKTAVVIFPASAHLTTSAGTTFTMTGLPAALQPAATSQMVPIANLVMENNGTTINSASVQVVTASGTLTFWDVTGAGGWTAPGARGFTQGAVAVWSLQ